MRPSRIPRRIPKIIFALGADECLAMLKGKIRVTHFFKVQSGEIAVTPGTLPYLLLKFSVGKNI